MGLHLNPQKSEIIRHDDASRGLVLNALPGAQVIDTDNATLLRSPIGDVACISAILEEKIRMLRTMSDRLKFIFSHDAILLHHSFAIPKLLYILRTSTCFLSPSLQEYDNLLRSTVSSIVNIHFEDPAWSQAILPVRSGGLGIRSAVQLAPSAFLASVTACSELITHILPPHLSCSTSTPHQDEALALWSRGHDTARRHYPIPPEGVGFSECSSICG